MPLKHFSTRGMVSLPTGSITACDNRFCANRLRGSGCKFLCENRNQESPVYEVAGCHCPENRHDTCKYAHLDEKSGCWNDDFYCQAPSAQ